MINTNDAKNSTLDGVGLRRESHDEDDYAMSIPMPVMKGATSWIMNPDEEPPAPELTAVYGDGIASIYEDGVKKSKFDVSAGDGTATSPKNKAPPQSSIIKSLFHNLLGGDDANESLKDTERERKWSEWMKSGRKVRDASATPGDVAALDDSLPLVDKGADYVLVAVPAAAADGVGPILPSFPGGKLFQKTVRDFQDVIVNGDGGSGGGGGNATAARVDDGKASEPKRRPKKPPPPPRKAKKAATTEDARARRERLRRSQYREPGKISANDWRHNIGNLASSTILRDVRGPVLWASAWATLWSVFHALVVPAAPPRWAGLARHLHLPTTQHSMMVSAMSFLLVFRTNSAYQRFAEGRKIWNDIVDTARDFSRNIKLYETAIGTSKCRRINNLLAAFPYLLRHRIRPSLMSGMTGINDPDVERDRKNSLLLYPDVSQRDTDVDAAARAYGEEEGTARRERRELCWVDRRTLPWKLLPGPALELCARAQNRPLWVCDRMAKELAVLDNVPPKFNNKEQLALIMYVEKLSRSIGACERIHQTAVPLNYARHALRSLTVWLWTLPFVLVKDLGLLTGPVVAVLSWILFGVYEIGSRIEDPFQGTLRLSIYCNAIRRDVLADSIARDTAFDLEDERKPSPPDEEGEYDDILELDSESEEYKGDGMTARKKKRTSKNDFFGNLIF